MHPPNEHQVMFFIPLFASHHVSAIRQEWTRSNPCRCPQRQWDADREGVHPDVESILYPLSLSTFPYGQTSRAVLLQSFPTSLMSSPTALQVSPSAAHLPFLVEILPDAFPCCPPLLLPLWKDKVTQRGFRNTAGLVSLILSV